MATATAFNSIQPPEDNMDMSSPANRTLDDDIEIDFDEYTGGVHVADGEQMVEDADLARPNTGTDDMMEDDIPQVEQALVDEEVMQDDGVEVQQIAVGDDEELIDYGEDEIHEVVEEDTVIPEEIEEPDEAADGVEAELEQTSEDASGVPGFAIPAVPPAGLLEEDRTVDEQFPNPQVILDDLLGHTASLEDGVHTEAEAAFADELHAFEEPEKAVERTQEALQAGADAAQAPISVNTALSTQADTPGTPTDTGLHPMTIRYGDTRMPLFKSRRQPDGLLKDDNLANLSLAELIQSCRRRLTDKIGEAISENQELILGFEHLGLMLVEDSRAAFESSLNDILDVYLQLHRNDAAADIPALSLTLSLQFKFASSFSLLKNAAAGGQGMSSFGFFQPLAEEEFYHEEYDDEEGAALHGQEDAEHQEDHGTYHEGEDAGEYHQQDQFEDEDGYREDTFEEGYNEDTFEEGYNEDPDLQPPGLEELLQGETNLTDTINNALDETAATGKEVVSESTAARLDATLDESKAGLSRESSTTEQGDHVNTNAAYTSSGNEDFSTFLTEFEAGEEGTSLPKDDQQDRTAQHVSEVLGESADETFNAQHLGSQDFLNDLGENDYEGQDHHGEHNAEDDYAPGDGFEQYGEEEYYDQANTFDEQQYEEEDHPDYQPGDEDEQFHTAQQDFLQGDFYEHGPEHDVDNEDEEGLDDTVNTVLHHDIGEDYQEDYEDDIGFDDETFEPHDNDGKAAGHAEPGSTLGNKRSHDDLADEDDIDFEERDVKKSRAS